MIHLHDIELSFEKKKVFNDFSLHVKRGEHVCLAGGSGKGKTSVLKMVQGYVQPNKGHVEINGEVLNVNTVNAIRSMLTIVPQNVNLPVQSGLELIQLLELEDKQQKIPDYLEQLNLTADFLKKSFNEISGGEKQRIVVSICLSQEKPVLLMDEPTASLDEKSIERLYKTISSLKELTVLSTSHNENWQKAADRIIHL